ncbi:MAG: polysaccharide lyase family protein [Chthoniobacteraceae bacterium]
MTMPSWFNFRHSGLAAAVLAVSVLLAAGRRSAVANVPGGGDSGPDVLVTQNGNLTTLSNGIITAEIDTRSAEITAIRYQGHEMVANTGKHRNVYFSRDGGASYERISHCEASLVQNTPDVADLSCKHVYDPAAKDTAAWNADVHFVLKKGASGLYIYVILAHPGSYPDLGIGEWRMVWSVPEFNGDFLLEKIYIDAARHWQTPSARDTAIPVPGAPKEVTQFTTGLWKDRYDCKYMYSSEYWGKGCWGFASDRNRLGGWFVFGSYEYFNDGPTKQDLTAAIGTGLIHFNMNHYNGSGIHIKQGQAWSKCYGPFFFYFNNKENGDACWEDAKAQAKAEEAAWPYAWVKNADYPLAGGRGTVRGRLVIKDALNPALTGYGAWVGLAQPQTGSKDNWQNQAAGYQFWVRAGADGSFTIPNVRPGNYALYGFTNGAVGEYCKEGVTVRAGAPTEMGEVTWAVPHKGTRIAWQIGVPDRDSSEFAHGKDYFMPLLFQRLPREIPEPLEYDVEKSDSTKNWYYAQCIALDSQGKPVASKWRIHFNLPRLFSSGTASLTIALAGSHEAALGVYVNNEARPLTVVTPQIQGGNALLREGNHAKYTVIEVPIPMTHLRTGANMITLSQTKLGSQSHVMYDYLSLELP